MRQTDVEMQDVSYVIPPQQLLNPQIHLRLANGQPATYTSKFEELDTSSQALMISIHNHLQTYRFEADLLEKGINMRTDSDLDHPMMLVKVIRQDLERVKHRNNVTLTEVKVMHALANKLSEVAEAMSTKFDMIMRFYPSRGIGLVARPSKYFQEKCQRQFEAFDKVVKTVKEVETLLEQHRSGPSAASLTGVVENVHEYLLHVAAKVERIHQFLSKRKDMVKRKITIVFDKVDKVSADEACNIFLRMRSVAVKFWCLLTESKTGVLTQSDATELDRLSEQISQQNIECSEEALLILKQTFLECIDLKILPFIAHRTGGITLCQLASILMFYSALITFTSKFFRSLESYKLASLEEIGMSTFFSQTISTDGRLINIILTAIREERDGGVVDLQALLFIMKGIHLSKMKAVVHKAVLKETHAYYTLRSSQWILELRVHEYLAKVHDTMENERVRLTKYLSIKEEDLSECLQAVYVPMIEAYEKHTGKASLSHGKTKGGIVISSSR